MASSATWLCCICARISAPKWCPCPIKAGLRRSPAQWAIRSKSRAALPLIKAGKLRALAVSSAARWPELPDVLTFAESGLAAFPPVVVFGLLAPAGTPPAIVAKLSAAETALLKSAATQAAIAKLRMSASIQTTAEFAKLLGDQVDQWKAVVKESGAHLGDREH